MPLRSSAIKLARADEHLKCLEAETGEFLNRDSHVFVGQHNADLTEYSVSVQFDGDPFPRWSAIVGDLVHNLRSALDNVVYEIAVHEQKADPPTGEDTLMFPIAKEQSEYPTWRIKPYISEPAFRRLDALQPFQCPTGYLDSALYWVNELNRRDKHRSVAVTSTSVSEWRSVLKVPAATKAKSRIRSSRAEDGAPFLILLFDRPTPDVEVHAASFQVLLERPIEGTNGNPVPLLPFLSDLVASTRNVVTELTATFAT